MPSFYDLMKYARTGIASPDMTAYDKLRAKAEFGGYPVSTITGVPPISFKSDGTPLTAWSIAGNGQQDGTPAPDAPIMPDFCGTLDGTDWTIPITCAGQAVPVYLGQVSTVRRVKKLVLDGTESPWGSGTSTVYFATAAGTDTMLQFSTVVSSHYTYHSGGTSSAPNNSVYTNAGAGTAIWFKTDYGNDVDSFKAFLAQEYAAGHPVTIWYVLAEPETAIINEPLCKIGTYADELHSADTTVTIPTAKGQNTLTVDTELQPSAVSVTGNIKPS